MWIKNAKIFNLNQDFKIDSDKLSEHLQDDKLKPCGPQDISSQGWLSPFKTGEMMCLQSGDAQLFNMGAEEKVVPSTVINQRLDEAVTAIQKETGNKVGRKQKADIKQEILFDILPTALTKIKKTAAYIDNKLNLLVVDASSTPQAENLVSQIRQTLGSFKAQAYGSSSGMATIMTKWITDGNAPNNFTFGNFLVLETLDEAKSVIRAKNVNFNTDEMQRHVDNGYLVTQIGLTYKDRIDFILTHEFGIKSIKFSDIVQDELDLEIIESEEQLLDSRFTIASLELRELLTSLLELFPQ
jgi:recombination associated protein RdgC